MLPDAARLYAARDFTGAAEAFRARARATPRDADVWVGLAQSLLAAGRPAEAVDAVAHARPLVRGPGLAVVELLAARAHAACGHVDQAEAAFRAATAGRAEPRALAAFGTWLVNESRLDEAELVLRRALAAGGDDDARASLAMALTQAGRAPEALELLRGRPRSSPPQALAWARACLATRAPAEALEAVDAVLPHAAPAQLAGLHHARALALDQLGHHPAAAVAFAAMHEARRVHVDPAAILAQADAILAAYPAPGARPPPRPGPRVAFLVGLPRSGTSLTEQALAAHSGVHAAGERDELRRLSLRFGQALGVPWPACAPRVPLAAAQGAELWYRAVAPRADATLVTDKMPDNQLRLGLAAQLFEDARAVWIRRDLMDTLLSCWQQSFGPALAWTSTWDGLVAMAEAHERLGAHWLRTQPLPVTEVRYEDLVTAPEPTLRALADFLGLPWEPAVLAPERVDRTVRTASIHQVRQPIHTGSVGRWRRYGAVLEPLAEKLAARGLLPAEA